MNHSYFTQKNRGLTGATTIRSETIHTNFISRNYIFSNYICSISLSGYYVTSSILVSLGRIDLLHPRVLCSSLKKIDKISFSNFCWSKSCYFCNFFVLGLFRKLKKIYKNSLTIIFGRDSKQIFLRFSFGKSRVALLYVNNPF